MKGLQVEQVTSLSEYASQIRGLRYNALNTGENRAPFLVRRKELGAVKHTLTHPHPDALFIAKDGEKVIGFLAVKRTPEGKKAQIRQLWTWLPGHPQRAIMAGLIKAAKHELTAHGYPRLNVDKVAPSSDFSVVRNSPAGGHYLRMMNAEDLEGEPTDIDISAEEENELPAEIMEESPQEPPEAANDNAAPLKEAA